MIKGCILKILDEVFSLFTCMKLFPFNIAIKVPVLFSHDVRIINCKRGCVKLPKDVRRHMIKIGFTGMILANRNETIIDCSDDSVIEFGEKVELARGFKCKIENSGRVKFGNNIYCNNNLSVQCEDSITFGNNLLIGWDTNIRDTDGHIIIEKGIPKKKTKAIKIEDNAWIAAEVTILKGSVISKGSVVACRSLVSGLALSESNCLIAGIPAKVIKKEISWEE